MPAAYPSRLSFYPLVNTIPPLTHTMQCDESHCGTVLVRSTYRSCHKWQPVAVYHNARGIDLPVSYFSLSTLERHRVVIEAVRREPIRRSRVPKNKRSRRDGPHSAYHITYVLVLGLTDTTSLQPMTPQTTHQYVKSSTIDVATNGIRVTKWRRLGFVNAIAVRSTFQWVLS